MPLKTFLLLLIFCLQSIKLVVVFLSVGRWRSLAPKELLQFTIPQLACKSQGIHHLKTEGNGLSLFAVGKPVFPESFTFVYFGRITAYSSLNNSKTHEDGYGKTTVGEV